MPNRAFDDATEAVITQRYANGEFAHKLAVEFFCYPRTIRRVANRHGVKRGSGRRANRQRDEATLRDYHAGLTLVQIAMRNGYASHQNVIAVLHRLERDGETVRWRSMRGNR